jgi:ABC-2 type transport system permease protein
VSRLVAAELLKLRTTPRTTIALFVAPLAVVALGTAGTVDSAADSSFLVERVLSDVVTGAAGTTAFFALLVGVVMLTTEYRHGTATHTFLAAPRRERVMAAKAAAAVSAGAALAVVAVVVGLAIALPWLAAVGKSPSLADADLAGDAGRVLFASALWATLGVGVGGIVRNQAGAIAAPLVWFLVAEPLVGVLLDGVADYLPGAVLASVLGWGGSALSASAAAGVAVAYVLTLGLLATALTLQRDVG